MENEIWKPIQLSGGRYEVSNCGRIKSVFSISKRGKVRLLGVVLKFHINSNGYHRTSILGKGYLVHRLVGFEFIQNTESKPFINHIDGNKLNNHVSNLEWCTNMENMAHAKLTGLVPTANPVNKYVKKGYNRNSITKPRRKIINIKTGERFDSPKELSDIIGMSIKNIHRQLNGERYNHTDYRYIGLEHLSKSRPT